MTKRSLFVAATAATLLVALPASGAEPPPPQVRDADGIDRTARAALDEGKYGFCTSPSRPLGMRSRRLCAIAAEVQGCEGYVAACRAGELDEEDRDWLLRLAPWLTIIAKAALFLLVMAIIVVVAIPVVRALSKWKRRPKTRSEDRLTSNVAVVLEKEPPPPLPSDAESALRLADEHHARGELERAMALYLTASLTALDQRGAVRLARHRTNGEYLRSCRDDVARPALREIVREVDRVEFGGAAPTRDTALRVAQRAQSIVRLTSTALVIALATLGCSPTLRGSDPAGDELPIDVLRRNGFKVSGLQSSLATMPLPNGEEGTPAVIVDAERVPIEDDARAHMMRWVEAGGVLVLFGHVDTWPSELAPTSQVATTRDLVVRVPDPNEWREDTDSDEIPVTTDSFVVVEGARIARSDAFTWKRADGVEPLAQLGEKTYAARRRIGKGFVLGVANDDLFTNVGVLPRRNAAALVALLRGATDLPTANVHVARPEDGTPPPANPFAALIAAGLGKGVWHALVATILLFLAYGIRRSRARDAEEATRRAFAEHIEATGAFYAQTKAHTHALSAYGRFVEMRLRETVPRGTDPATFLAAHSGIDPERAVELYTRALQADAKDEPRGDELRVIEELRRMLERALAR